MVRIENQRFIESPQKGTPGFRLMFRILRSLDKSDASVKSLLRDITWWVSEKSASRVLRELQGLGYPGSTLRGLDPRTNGFYDFRGQEIEVMCDHEEGETGAIFERWSVLVSKPNADEAKLLELDRMLAREQAGAKQYE